MIEKYVDAHLDEMIEDLRTLCRINSVRTEAEEGAPFGKGPLAALNTASEMAEKYGFTVTDHDHHLRTADLYSEGIPALDILGHVDVVPAGEGWTETEPFEPVLKDGRVYGRGCADDKGGVISALYAMRAVKELGIPVSRRCRLIIGSAEETGMEDVNYYYSRNAAAPMTVSPDASYPVINIEKGRVAASFDAEFAASSGSKALISLDGGIAINQVPASASAVLAGMTEAEILPYTGTITEKTGVTFDMIETDGEVRIRANGQAAHASTPGKGCNSVIALAELILKLPLDRAEGLDILSEYISLYPFGDHSGRYSGMECEDDISGPTTCAPDIMHMTGTSFHAEVDYRTACRADGSDFEGILGKAAERMGARLTILDQIASHVVPENSAFVQTLLECYSEATGEKAGCVAMGGSTYVHGIEGGVAFGHLPAGEDVHEHGPNEYMPVEYLKKTAVIYALSIAKLCR